MNDQSNSPVTPDVATATIQLMQSMLDRRKQIEGGLAHTEGTHTFDDLVLMVLNGRLLWWPLPNSFLLTEVITYPQTRHLHVFLAGGDLDEVRAQQDNLVALAKGQGCSAVTLSGRRGWIKALADLGWRECHSSMLFTIQKDETNG